MLKFCAVANIDLIYAECPDGVDLNKGHEVL